MTAEPVQQLRLLPVAEWRRAVMTADLPRNTKIVGLQLAHYAIGDDAREVSPPTMLVLGAVSELPHRTVLAAVSTLRRRGWLIPGDDDEDRSVLRFGDPRGGAR